MLHVSFHRRQYGRILNASFSCKVQYLYDLLGYLRDLFKLVLFFKGSLTREFQL
jgi:hypothetical protein